MIDIVVLAAVMSLGPSSADELRTGSRYAVEIAALPLQASQRERVRKLRVVTRCGSLAPTSSMPADWVVKIGPMPFPRTTLIATVPDDGRTFRGMNELSGFVSVQPLDLSCFELSLVISTSVDGGDDRDHVPSRDHLKLRRQ